MPTSDRDLQGLTYFARRLREDTHGCAPWDDSGTYAVFKTELAGTNLLIALERVIGHATDPEARTPGAIKRPFTPEPVKTEPPKPRYDPRTTCHLCGKGMHDGSDHTFLSVEANRARIPAPAPDDLRGAITPTRVFGTSEEKSHG